MDAETEFETMVMDAIRSEWVRAGPVAVAGVVALAREIHPAQSKRIREAVREARALMDESERLEFAAAMEGLRTEAKGLAAGEQVAAFVERSRTLATVGQQSTWLRPGVDAQSGARTGKTATSDAETR